MSRGRARLAMSEGLAAWVLEAPEGFGDAGFHTHHAIQLIGRIEAGLGQPGDRARFRQLRHRFEADGLLAFIFVEPESHAGRALSETVLRGRPLAEIDSAAFARAAEPLREAFAGPLTHEAMLAIATGTIRASVRLIPA